MVDGTNYAWQEPTPGGAEGQYVDEHNDLVNDIKATMRAIETAFDSHASDTAAHHDPIVPGDGLAEQSDGTVDVAPSEVGTEEFATGAATAGQLLGESGWVDPPDTGSSYSAGDGLSLSNTTFSVAPSEVGTEEFDSTRADSGQVLGKSGWTDVAGPVQATGLGDDSFEVSADQKGIDMQKLSDITYQGQGMAYNSSDGYLYIAQVTDSASPSTIHQHNPDGSPTGDSYQIEDSSANHTSGIEWHNGYLWAFDFNANSIFKLDYYNKNIVGQFDYGGGVVAQADLSAGTFIPTAEGGAKILAACWRSNEAHLINFENAISAGTASGNIYETLQNGLFRTPQGVAYHGGHLYMTWDSFNRQENFAEGPGVIQKIVCPNADAMKTGFPLSGQGIVWTCYNNLPVTGGSSSIQDLAFDPVNRYWYTTEEFAEEIYRGREGTFVEAPGLWRLWNTADGGPGDTVTIDVDTAVESSEKSVPFTSGFDGFPGWAEVWFYDDGNASKRVYTGILPRENPDRAVLGVNTDQGTDNYWWWTSGTGWTNTGITRPDTPRWVKFGFEATGSDMGFYVSKTRGKSWQSGGRSGTNATLITSLILQPLAGSARVGSWTIEPDL